ncbi:hypothetical protein CXK91_16345 [Stutzerimonas stutzeri]|uniref:Uncharacterized protein n=1 Tax=Stutzerimonas stutzeri TaxID=316 RepID=A0A2S4AL01_STUST|nr:hypothetical protein CXK91_16345 [Stutzerimonas stutzeri]
MDVLVLQLAHDTVAFLIPLSSLDDRSFRATAASMSKSLSLMGSEYFQDDCFCYNVVLSAL